MLTMLSGEQKLAEIKRLYYQTTRPTIAQDLAKAIDLVKSMTSEEERERAAVYMDGPLPDALGLGAPARVEGKEVEEYGQKVKT
jgi:hypothetical protein